MTRTILTRTPVFFIFFLPIVLPGQTLKSNEKDALEAFEKRNYSLALSCAESLLSVDSQRIDALFICGESALNIGALELAETYFQRIPNRAKQGIYAVTDLRLAMIKNELGKCSEAWDYFEKYRYFSPVAADVFLLRAEDALENCNKLKSPEAKSSHVEILHLNKNINTDGPEFAPLRYVDKIYFSSMPPDFQGEKTVSRIYSAVRDELAVAFAGNPKENDVHAIGTALTPKADRIYYSLCDSDTSGNPGKCKIWFRERTYEGNWGPLKKMPPSVNLSGYSAVQPAVGYDKSLRKEVLFFVSDRPGGKGKLDIWCSTISFDGTVGEPFNLPFNSPQDDITPFFHTATQTIFFSSNKPESRGGFDIFRAEKAATGDWTEPRNMDYPINTSFNDMYFTFHSGSKRGYFSSDRPTEKCPEKDLGCQDFDIFEARMFVDLDVSVFDAADSTALSKCNIELMDLETEIIETTLVRMENNRTVLPLDLGKAYRLIVSREGYLPDFTDLSTTRMSHPAEMKKLIYLNSMRGGRK